MRKQNLSQLRAETTVSALAVSSRENDLSFLRVVFGDASWKLHEVHNISEALILMKRRHLDLVITDRDLPDGTWRRLLDAFRSLPSPPPLIVTSRLADEYLWAEVLNEGGFDVLAQPLDREETVRVISAATRRSHNDLCQVRQRRPAALGAGA